MTIVIDSEQRLRQPAPRLDVTIGGDQLVGSLSETTNEPSIPLGELGNHASNFGTIFEGVLGGRGAWDVPHPNRQSHVSKGLEVIARRFVGNSDGPPVQEDEEWLVVNMKATLNQSTHEAGDAFQVKVRRSVGGRPTSSHSTFVVTPYKGMIRPHIGYEGTNQGNITGVYELVQPKPNSQAGLDHAAVVFQHLSHLPRRGGLRVRNPFSRSGNVIDRRVS